MLTFFRRIRKGLLGDGATSKYLLYAIGEIALVVIGILIALQVNNWNQRRVDQQFERLYLQEILNNLYADKEEIIHVISLQEDWMNTTKKCLNILTDDLLDKFNFDSLFESATLGNPTFFPKVGGYNSLVTQRGTKIIKNKVVLDHITQLYEQFYNRIKTNGGMLDQRFTEMLNKKNDIYSSYSQTFLRNEWRNSEKTVAILDYTYSIRERVIWHLHNTLMEIEKAIEVIEENLE